MSLGRLQGHDHCPKLNPVCIKVVEISNIIMPIKAILTYIDLARKLGV
jgi:hypothetical protein